MNINSTEGLLLKGYNAANSGNCGVRIFGFTKATGAYTSGVAGIKFNYNGNATGVQFMILVKGCTTISNTSNSVGGVFEYIASFEFKNWSIYGGSGNGGFTQDVWSNSDGAGNPGGMWIMGIAGQVILGML